MTTRPFLVAVCLITLEGSACTTRKDDAVQATQTRQASAWRGLVNAFLEDYLRLNPGFAAAQGRHEYDGQLPDWSAAGLQAQIDLLKKAVAQAQAIDPAGLNAAERFEREYLLATLDGMLFWRDEVQWPRHNADFYVTALDPSVYTSRPYADASTRMKAFIKYARNVPVAAAQINAGVIRPLSEADLKYAQAGFGGYAEFYAGDAKAAFASVTDAALQKELDEAVAAAAKAMRDLASHLGTARPTTDRNALGAQQFSDMLRRVEGVKVSLSELKSIGIADLRRNQAALAKACAAFAPQSSIAKCMATMSAHKAEGDPVKGAREQLPRLRAFILEKNLVSIPGTEEARVEEAPPYNRQNFAYIDTPGPYETAVPSVCYIAPPDPAWDAKTRAEYVPGRMKLLVTSIHEVWPGHFLNSLHSHRASSAFGKLFGGYAYSEGWAHYSEEMMLEAGLNDGDPETQIGQRSEALLRDCRFLSAIGLHTEGMTIQQSYDLFRKECYQDAGTAMQQAGRGSWDPAYLSYTLGKLMIRKLREDWTAKHFPGDPRSGWKAFHDQFLSFGGPPIPLVRKAMMEEGNARSVF